MDIVLKWLIVKVVTREGYIDRCDATIGWIDVVSHHLQSPLLGAIELNNRM